MQKKSEKQEQPIKDQNALKNMLDSFHTLTQNWLHILHYGCLNQMFRIEFNAGQVFLLKLGNSALNAKYGNYSFSRFLLLFFSLRKNCKEFCKTDCRFGLPDHDFLWGDDFLRQKVIS